MKKLLFISALLLKSVFSQGAMGSPEIMQKPAKGYVINGTLKGNAENAKVKLLDLTDETKEPVAIDSTIVKNGKFQFKGKIETPAMYTIFITLQDTKLPLQERNLAHKLYLENTNMTFDADVATMTSYYYYPQRKGIPVVTGSATQALSEDLSNQLKDITGKLSTLNGKYLKDYHIPSSEGKDLSEIGIKYQNEIDQLREQRKAIILDFIKKQPASPVAFDQTSYLAYDEQTVEQYDELLSILKPAWAGKKRFEELKKRINIKKNMAIGVKLPNAEFLNEKGEKVMLSSLLANDKYTLVEFWASWCGPCRGEIPHLKIVKEKYPQFNIISISIDESDSKWKKALKEENMNWEQINYPNGFKGVIQSIYGIQGVPAGFIIDKEGRIAASDMRGAALDKFLYQAYGE